MRRLPALALLLVLGACGDESAIPRARTLSPERADHPNASYSPDGARIYWWQPEGDRWRLWMSPADMSAPESLALKARFHYEPIWSPDGSRFAVGAAVNTTLNVVWVMSASGGEPHRVSSGDALENPIGWHPDGRRLAYQTLQEGGVATMAVDADSGTPRRLLPGETRPHIAFWSPDGSRLAINMYELGRNTIWLADSAGGGLRQATTDGFEFLAFPKPWSPDGSAVLYTSRRTGRDDIWVLPADSGAPRQLTHDVRDDYSPVWSPDGRWIAFASNRGLQTDLWVMPAAGGEPRRITDDALREALRDWRPGTSEVAYNIQKVRRSLWAHSLADGAERQLTHDSVDVTSFNLSATGQVSVRIERGGGVSDIGVLPQEGGEPRILLADARAGVPYWTPDGSKLVFQSDRGGPSLDIWVMDAAGDALRQLTTWPEYELIPPVFSADGSEVYFISEREVTTFWFDLWRVPLAGGEPTRITRTGRVLDLCWQSRRPTELLVLAEAPVTQALMRVRPDGTLRPVWDRSTANCGTVSPTSDSVAVLTSVAAGQQQAMLVPLNGGPGRRILEANQVPVAWSPDGRQLLFRYTVGQPYDLGILDLASGSTRRITSTPASEIGTEWSADGSTLVFIRTVSDYGITTADLTRLLARPE